ncbi:hypothetical protein COCC4DRAFT_69370 [Bipolaris maydis ATCC 48331]|uniref:Uncharacterized protein n=1 Tax=Cochliobolus heterostrophus (strain C4 / ATCC 48331 / race T) TaxID=665024 RepID=N4XAM2_COCH4|nr:uncharacterized protein COCC4DRAFT_69370 [Bipolaris maydis ATCC 48331]ENI08740.1 hypothetical protein COCC4DRAFT_69370 [Bipolaris maydis ATCC 48331]
MADMLGGGGGLLALVQASTCAVPYHCRLCWGTDKGNPEFVMATVYDGCSTAPIFTALGSANRSSVSRSSPTGQQVYPPIHCGLQRGIFALPQSPFYLLNASPRLTSEVAANAPAATLFAFLSLYVTTSHATCNAVCPGSGSLQADLRPGASLRSIHPPEFFCVPSAMPMQREAYNGTYDMPVPHFAHGTTCRFIRALDATPSA